MGALLICDAPGCLATQPAASVLGRIAAPPETGWWAQAVSGSVSIGCCQEHFIAASKVPREPVKAGARTRPA